MVKKVYSTPEGLKFSASNSFGNASLAWFANIIWQFLLLFINASGITSVILNLVGFILLIYGAVTAFIAFDSEIQANALEHSDPDRSLTVMKKLVMTCIVIRAILSVLSFFVAILFNSLKNSVLYDSINGFINIFGNIFTSVNIMGIFAYKLFIKEGYDKKIKIYSIISLASIAAHFILAEIRYILLVTGSDSPALSYTALITSVISYIALFFLFESRKAIYKPSAAKESDGSEKNEN